MPDREAIESGFAFEKRFAAETGAKLRKGSGNKWYAKMDVAGLQILWSLKWTGKKTFTIDRALVREAINAVDAPGGEGGDTLPGFAFEVDGESYVMFRATDFVGALQEGRKFVKQTKSDAKRESAKIPVLLREE